MEQKKDIGGIFHTGHSLKEWVAVTRYWSFAVSAMPVVVTFAFLCYLGMVSAGSEECPGHSAVPYLDQWLNFALALVGAVVLHAAGNVLSDWSDYRKGVDSPRAYAVRNLVDGLFTPSQYLHFSILLFIAGIAIGIWLTVRTGAGLLVIGGAGVLLTALYSFLKYRALGDLDIFVIFSVLIMTGTSWVVCGRIVPQVLLLAVPLGIITVSVLHANNTVDIGSDGEAGIKTFAMVLGPKVSCRLYQVYMILPFVWIIGCVAAGLLPLECLLSLVAAVIALKNFSKAGRYDKEGIEAVKGLDQASAKLQLVFSGLLALTLFISAALH